MDKAVINRITTNPSKYSFSDGVIYEMCRLNPKHEEVKIVAGKMLIINRVYSAGLERSLLQKDGGKIASGNFIYDYAAPALIKANLDEHIQSLQDTSTFTDEVVISVLVLHHLLAAALKQEHMWRYPRSFASKYLHFHLPNLFFIYDSFAHKKLSRFKLPRRHQFPKEDNIDDVYAKFLMRSLDLREHIYQEYNVHLSPRQIDRVLLEY